ncbi:MAG: hypothetical protein ABI683_03095 [Ginsengibacter sp.]
MIKNKTCFKVLPGFLSSFICTVLVFFLNPIHPLAQIETDSQDDLKEKVFLHTDRSFYLCGEILWLKAYVTSSANNKPASISKVMYVELLNRNHQPVLQQKIVVKSGSGSGSVLLPCSLSSGNYEIRAYTNWMKNFPATAYFRKKIAIVNTTKNLDDAGIASPAHYTAAFFPEGGNLVNGLKSEIAFKVTDDKNKGIDCAGIIVDESNDTVASFKTFHAGMGHFYLTPATGKNYSAVVTCKDASVIKNDLPKVYDAGYVMHVDDTTPNQLKISIASTGGNISAQVYVLFQNNGHINARSQRVENGNSALLIDKDSLHDGMTRITVFDENKQPQCERLYFKRPKNKLVITPATDKTSYGLRGKVLVDVGTTNGDRQPLSGNLSVSVFRLDSLHQPDEENIFSYLWLSSNVQGTIEDPAYYLSKESEETNEALEDLLLTQGWRKFDWDKANQNRRSVFTYAPEYAGHIITGRITNESTNKAAPDVLVYLSVPGRRVQLKGCISDGAGYVHFDMKDFIGSSQIVLQTNSEKENKYRIEIFTPYSEHFSDDVIPALHVSESDEEELKQGNFHMEVQNGYHQKELESPADMQIDSLPFYYKPFKTYLLDNYTRFTTMEEVMREYVNEISVRRSGTDFRFMTLNEPGFKLQNKQPVEVLMKDNPLVLMDGVPVFDINKIIAYDPLKIQKLEVVASRYYWGPIIADGIISYTTYKGDLEGYTLDPNDLVLDYDALQQQRIFYSPDYSSDKLFQSPIPDYRDVLYWSPDISTNDQGKAKFSFYTGDLPGKYVMILQGIAVNGEAGSASTVITVEK